MMENVKQSPTKRSLVDSLPKDGSWNMSLITEGYRYISRDYHTESGTFDINFYDYTALEQYVLAAMLEEDRQVYLNGNWTDYTDSSFFGDVKSVVIRGNRGEKQ